MIQEIVFYIIVFICWLLGQCFDSYIELGWALPVLTVLWLVFKNFIWQILPASFIKQYNIQGQWSGDLYYNYNGQKGTKQVFVIIKQNFLKTEITIKTNEMLGKSVASRWCFEQNKLLYIYNTDPKSEVKDRNPIQWGGAQIKIEPNNLNKLRIEYWTDRQTKGYMELIKNAK